MLTDCAAFGEIQSQRRRRRGRRRARPRWDPRLEVLAVIEPLVAQTFGTTRSELRQGRRGSARVASARQAAMYLAHISWGLPYTEVGRLFARDRTTIAHACATVEDRRDDTRLDRTLDLLTWSIVLICHRAQGIALVDGGTTK